MRCYSSSNKNKSVHWEYSILIYKINSIYQNKQKTDHAQSVPEAIKNILNISTKIQIWALHSLDFIILHFKIVITCRIFHTIQILPTRTEVLSTPSNTINATSPTWLPISTKITINIPKIWTHSKNTIKNKLVYCSSRKKSCWLVRVVWRMRRWRSVVCLLTLICKLHNYKIVWIRLRGMYS
jgi:hypothetical protein